MYLVTLGHFLASFWASPLVTLRQLLSPKPSARASVIFFVPHHDGAPARCVPLLPELPLVPPPPQPTTAAATAAQAATAPTFVSVVLIVPRSSSNGLTPTCLVCVRQSLRGRRRGAST